MPKRVQRAQRSPAVAQGLAPRVSRAPNAQPAEHELVTRLRGHLDFLRLTHTLAHLDDRLAWARHHRPGATSLLEHVLGAEVEHKRDARIEGRIRKSGLPERKTLEAFDWDFQPSLDKSTVVELACLDFVKWAEDIVITGQAGTGKSHILKAIGLRACERGLSFRYVRAVDLLDDLHAGLADATYPKRLRSWVRPQLLVIDDVGIGHVKKRDNEPTAAHTLYNLIDKRHSRCSTAITSNIALSEWGHYLGDATITVAILDRLVMNALRLHINGPSYRKHVADDRARRRGQSKATTRKTSTTRPTTAKERIPNEK